MKVMFLTEYYPPDINVAGIRISEMVKQFSRKQNVNVRVVVYNPDRRASRHKEHTILAENADCVRYGRKYLPRLVHLMGLLNPFTLMCWCYYTIVQTYLFKPDVIIATVPSIIPGISASLASRITRTPYCIDMRDNWINKNTIDYFISPLPRYAQSVYKFLFKPVHKLYIKSCMNSAIIITVYDNLATEIRKYTGNSKPVIHIPNGINPEEFERVRKAFNKKGLFDRYHIPCRDGAKHIIFTGVIGGYYKPEVLLKPMIELIKKGHDINYILIGEGNLKETVRHMAMDSGIGDRVFLLDSMSHEEIIRFLMASDLAFYALDENFPNPDYLLGVKVLEYIACKLPVLSVAVDHASVSKIVRENGIGITLSWRETDKIADALERLMSDEKYRANIETYYPRFMSAFNRMANNDRLFYAIACHQGIAT